MPPEIMHGAPDLGRRTAAIARPPSRMRPMIAITRGDCAQKRGARTRLIELEFGCLPLDRTQIPAPRPGSKSGNHRNVGLNAPPTCSSIALITRSRARLSRINAAAHSADRHVEERPSRASAAPRAMVVRQDARRQSKIGLAPAARGGGGVSP